MLQLSVHLLGILLKFLDGIPWWYSLMAGHGGKCPLFQYLRSWGRLCVPQTQSYTDKLVSEIKRTNNSKSWYRGIMCSFVSCSLSLDPKHLGERVLEDFNFNSWVWAWCPEGGHQIPMCVGGIEIKSSRITVITRVMSSQILFFYKQRKNGFWTKRDFSLSEIFFFKPMTFV